MLDDLRNSFSENIKEKTKNPFLGTYLMVWLARNWDLLYTVFNFSESDSLDYRLSTIRQYLVTNKFLTGLLQNVCWTFFVLVLSYLLINLARYIVNLFDKRLTPIVYKWSDHKSVIEMDRYNLLKTERDELQTKLEKEREHRTLFEQKYEQVLNSKNNLQTTYNELALKLSDVDSKSMPAVPPATTDPIQNTINRLGKSKSDFLIMAINIKKGLAVDNAELFIDDYLKIGLIEFVEHRGSGSAVYRLTDIGNRVFMKLTEL
jgi:hypothetical protein